MAYEYDVNNHLSSSSDNEGNTTSYAYDSMGRILSSINAIGSKTTYEYNCLGLLEKVVNAREQDTTYEYDALGRITSMTDELGTIKYTYDANGNVLTVCDEHGTIKRTYDELNRIKTYTDYKGNTIGYGYDELGNLISLTYPGGEIVRYTYYDNGYLHTVTDENGNITSYEYDANGNLFKTTRPDGSVETRTYNEANWLMQISDKTVAGEVINQYDYTYDVKGNITGIRETTPDAVTADDSVGVSTDKDDGTSGIKNVDLSAVTSAAMTYDAANRLISYNGEEVKYDADGNMIYGPVNGEMVELEYDCRNRLVRAGDTTYEYDAENVRTAIETPEYREEYVTDSSGELSRVLVITRYKKVQSDTDDADSGSEKSTDNESLSDTGSTDNNSAKYASTEAALCYYGNGLIYERTGEELLVFHYNNIGSTTCITDQTGAVVERYDYGTYGELLSGDISITSFLYNGQYGVMNDANGLYYMRARYYNPEIKRFINQDVVNGTITNSQSLNKYCYVQGNPVSLIDPFGLSPLSAKWNNFSRVGHGVLNYVGMISGKIGLVADGINALWYLAEGQYGNAFWSGVAMLNNMDLVGKASKYAISGGRYATTAMMCASMATTFAHATTFIRAGKEAGEGISYMYDKYAVRGEKVGWDTAGETVSVALNVMTMYTSGKAMHSTSQLKQGSSGNADTGVKDSTGSKGSSDSTKLYRVMSEAEYDSVLSNRKFVPYDKAMEEKWFATTQEDATRWGEIFYPDGNFRMVEIEVDISSLNKMYYNQKLDNIGPAYCSSLEVLESAIKNIKGVK